MFRELEGHWRVMLILMLATRCNDNKGDNGHNDDGTIMKSTTVMIMMTFIYK